MTLAPKSGHPETHDLKFQHLLASARAIGELRNIDELLDFMAKQAASAIKCDRCSIFLVDQEKDEIWSKVSLGEKMIRFSKNLGVAGKTIESGEAILITDAYHDKRFNQEIDRQTGYVTRSLLSVPMRNSEMTVMGCFQLINKLHGDFNENDCDYLQAFANQAAVAIETALLYQRQESMIKDLEATQASLENKMRELEFVYQLEHAQSQSPLLDDFVEAVFKVIFKYLRIESALLSFVEQKSVHVFVAGNEKILVKRHNLLSLNQSMQEQVLSLEEAKGDWQKIKLDAIFGKESPHYYQLPFQFQGVNPDQLVIGRFVLGHKNEDFAKLHEALLKILPNQLASAIYRYKLLEEREKAQRFAAIGHFSSTIVHDFRNPMMGIRGFAELIQMSLSTMDEQQLNRLCDLIVKQVDRCSSMIEELLQFTRGKKTYQFAACSVPELLKEVEDLVQVSADRAKVRLEVECRYSGELILDRNKILRAILNLTNNALEMLKEGDSLKLSSKVRDDGWVEIRVTDSGPGVPLNLRANLFEQFVTQGKSKGNGLGLFITKDIVEAHGGSIYLDEEVTVGASFVMGFDPNYRPEIGDQSQSIALLC
ncbi:MAG: GAF domain-containing sensor histidine kinase [Oligoflexus sp.]